MLSSDFNFLSTIDQLMKENLKKKQEKLEENTSLIQNIAFDQGFCSTKDKSSWGNMHIYAFI